MSEEVAGAAAVGDGGGKWGGGSHDDRVGTVQFSRVNWYVVFCLCVRVCVYLCMCVGEREKERKRKREIVCVCAVCLCVSVYTFCDPRQVSVCRVGQMVFSACIIRDRQIHLKKPTNLSKKTHNRTIYVCQKRPTNTSKDTHSGSVGTVNIGKSDIRMQRILGFWSDICI